MAMQSCASTKDCIKNILKYTMHLPWTW